MTTLPETGWWRPALPAPAAGALAAGSEPAEPGSRVPFVALMAFTAVLLIAPQSLVPALAPLRPGLLTAAAALAAYLLDCVLRGRPALHPTPELKVTAALAGWAVVTVPLSSWPGGSLSFLLESYFKTLVIFWLLASVVNTPRRLRQSTWVLCLLSVPLAAFAVREYLSGRFVDQGPVKRIFSYEAPLTANPNDLALMLNLILPLAAALALGEGRPALRLLALAIAVVAAAGVIVTFSRAGFLTLMVSGVITMFRLLRRPERGWGVAILAAAIIALPLLPSGYVDRLSTITDIEADPTGSAQERWGDTRAAIAYVAGHPIFGAGVGMNILALNEVRGPLWKEVHNVYLEYAADLGLPGLVLFLVLFRLCLRAAGEARRRAAGRKGGRPVMLLAEGLQTSLAAFAVAGLFHPVAYDFYFYYIAGLALGARTASAGVAS